MPNKTPYNVFCGVYTLPSSANIRNKTKIYLSAVMCITNHCAIKCVVCIQALSSHGICIRKKARHMECFTKAHAKVIVSGQVCSNTGNVRLYICTPSGHAVPLHTIRSKDSPSYHSTNVCGRFSARSPQHHANKRNDNRPLGKPDFWDSGPRCHQPELLLKQF